MGYFYLYEVSSTSLYRIYIEIDEAEIEPMKKKETVWII
ncbi:MAG: hypothetical protein Sylvanvirus26_5 [Sylvanvirus sp.]|uniref:Uncharacterized protein n=1 Tax=Sylvanvirus sp. TaxID=2487774 RepID=A0A3G5AIT7_9VIRU|nr:MAG: hypothetical protein Sylvanvirus26_5 [Sylvanvirus sp.]